MAEELLKQVGLNLYEIKAYLALLSSDKNSLQAGELSSSSGVPMARIYDIMVSLERKGFAKIGLGRPTLYQAVLPDEALESYKRRMEIEFERRLKDFESMKKELTRELQKKKMKALPRVKESFSLYEGDDALIALERIIKRAKNISILSSLPFKIFKPLLDEKKGVSIRFLSGEKIREGWAKFLEKSSPLTVCMTGDEILIMDCSYDGKRLSGTALWSNSKVLLSIFKWIFDQLWRKK
jgi:sugar-specific transcriptional regulator TrmB